jgi:hypothetical protein
LAFDAERDFGAAFGFGFGAALTLSLAPQVLGFAVASAVFLFGARPLRALLRARADLAAALPLLDCLAIDLLSAACRPLVPVGVLATEPRTFQCVFLVEWPWPSRRGRG